MNIEYKWQLIANPAFLAKASERRICLYTFRRNFFYRQTQPSSFSPLQQIRQSDQILVTEEAPPCGDLNECVYASCICTTGQYRLQAPFSVAKIDTILTPVLAILDQLKLATEQRMKGMGYAELPPRTALTRCI